MIHSKRAKFTQHIIYTIVMYYTVFIKKIIFFNSSRSKHFYIKELEKSEKKYPQQSRSNIFETFIISVVKVMSQIYFEIL